MPTSVSQQALAWDRWLRENEGIGNSHSFVVAYRNIDNIPNSGAIEWWVNDHGAHVQQMLWSRDVTVRMRTGSNCESNWDRTK